MHTIMTCLLLTSAAWGHGPEPGDDADPVEHTGEASDPYVWSIEPIKLGSLMLNIHPDWAAFGIESGWRLHERVWLQTFIEIDKGSLHHDYYEPGRDFLISHHYRAWLTTGRYVFAPDARHGGFLEAGLAIQWLWQQHLDPKGRVQSNTGMALGPTLLGGYEWHIGKGNAFFKVRGGGGWNALRQGDIDGHLDLVDHDEQARGYYSPYTHLTEVIFQPFYYIGDIAFGFKFRKRRR